MLENIFVETYNSAKFPMFHDNLKSLSARYNLWKKEEESYRFCHANHMVPIRIIDNKIIFSYVEDKDDRYGNIVNTGVSQFIAKEGYIFYCIDYFFRKKEDRFPKDSFEFWVKTKRNEEDGEDRLCCCTNINKLILYGKYKYIPLDKRIEISLEDGSLDIWTYKE